jgi:Na+/H+ antiporter NhaC
MEAEWISVIPPVLAVVLAFVTREAATSLALACFAGVLLMGQGPQGFPGLVTRALGNESFVWVCSIELCIGVLVAFFQRSGAISMFTERAGSWVKSRKQVGVLGWGLGLFIFFSDYFSPLFVGPVMRDLTDKYRISREKLAYIADSTSAPLVLLMPFSGWAAYLMGLVSEEHDAMSLFLRAIPFNFYAYLAVLMVLFISLGLIPEFGPMRAAEKRAMETGQVLRDGAVPMMGKELTMLEPSPSRSTGLFWSFVLPIAIIVSTNVGSFFLRGSAAILESFMLAVSVLAVILWLQKVDDWNGIMASVYTGIKGVMPAVVILALAYCINAVSREMGTAQYIISVTESWMVPSLLPLLLFAVSAVISFATGTSWGTYAIMVPIALPLAISITGDASGTLVVASFAAVAGGGVFGDHVSPLSDTTVLSSLGSASDHIDHVRTQLPYALTVAGVACALYLFVGFTA